MRGTLVPTVLTCGSELVAICLCLLRPSSARGDDSVRCGVASMGNAAGTRRERAGTRQMEASAASRVSVSTAILRGGGASKDGEEVVGAPGRVKVERANRSAVRDFNDDTARLPHVLG